MIRRPIAPEAPHMGPSVAKPANFLFDSMSLSRNDTLRRPRHASDACFKTSTGEAPRRVWERLTHLGGVPVKVVGNPYGFFLILQITEGEDKGRQITCDFLEDIRFITLKQGD